MLYIVKHGATHEKVIRTRKDHSGNINIITERITNIITAFVSLGEMPELHLNVICTNIKVNAEHSLSYKSESNYC